MDHAEEQAQELEALESIYYDSFERLSDAPPSFRVHIKPEDFDEAVRALERQRAARSGDDSDDDGDGSAEPLNYFLKITFPEKYPEELPEMEVEDASQGLEEEDIELILNDLKSVAEENLGMPMVFTLATAAKDKVEETIRLRKEAAEKEREERLAREEAEEAKRREGTKVTPESFAAWKKAFLKEMIAANRSDLVWFATGAKVAKGKLTGKQLFEQDKGLAMSDSQYMEAGDVTVDTELFDEEELGDLDLSDDEEDNEVLKNLDEDD